MSLRMTPRATRHGLISILCISVLAAPSAARAGEIPLAQRWSVEAEDELLLGVVRDALMDEAGFVYLLDEQLARIAVISPEGELDRIIGREGEGPGEFRWPGDLLWLPGPELGVLDNRRGEISRLGLDGTPAGSWLMRGDDGLPLRSASMAQAGWAAETLVVLFGEPVNRKGEFKNAFTLAIVAESGELLRRILSSPRGWDFAKREYVEKDEYLAGRGWWTLGPDGRIYLAPERNSYRVEVLSPEGERELSFGRDEFRPRLRSAEEKRRMADSRTMFLNGEKVKIACEIEEHDPVIRHLHVDDEGRVWVRHCAAAGEDPAGSEIAFDLFDGEGNFIEKVLYTGVTQRDADQLIVLEPGRFLLLRAASDAADEDEAPEPLTLLLLEAG